MSNKIEGLTMNQLADRNAELHMQIAELQRKVEALAAEVQAIRWASGQVYAKGYNHGHLNTVDGLPYAEEKDLVIRGGETLCEYIDPDHCGVATDAILTEIRAQGNWIDSSVEPEFKKYYVRYIAPGGPRFCIAEWFEYDPCVPSDRRVKIWLPESSRGIYGLENVTHYCELPVFEEAGQ